MLGLTLRVYRLGAATAQDGHYDCRASPCPPDDCFDVSAEDADPVPEDPDARRDPDPTGTDCPSVSVPEQPARRSRHERPPISVESTRVTLTPSTLERRKAPVPAGAASDVAIDDIRDNPSPQVASDCPVRPFFARSTSSATGEPSMSASEESLRCKTAAAIERAWAEVKSLGRMRLEQHWSY